jgi:hypothetical protein
MVRADLESFERFGREHGLLRDEGLPAMRYFVDERLLAAIGPGRYEAVEQAFLAHNGTLEAVPPDLLKMLATHEPCDVCIVFGYREVWNTPLVARVYTTYGKAGDPDLDSTPGTVATTLMHREHAYLWCLGGWVRLWNRPVRSADRS